MHQQMASQALWCAAMRHLQQEGSSVAIDMTACSEKTSPVSADLPE